MVLNSTFKHKTLLFKLLSKVLLHGKIWSISTYPSPNSLSISIDCLENFVERNLAFLENSEIKQKVKTRNGALTSQLRYNWGVEAKNRGNNLHHAETQLACQCSIPSFYFLFDF
jgi:hypothetical protein